MRIVKYLQNLALHMQGYKTEEEIDFVAFSYQWCDRHKKKKGVKNYVSSVKALCKFFGKTQIMLSEITVKNMKLFEESLEDRPRAQTMYTSSITRLFNEAVEYYNDEDKGIIIVMHSLKKKTKGCQEKRASCGDRQGNIRIALRQLAGPWLSKSP